MAELKGSHYHTRQDDQRKSIVQRVLARCKDSPRRPTAPAKVQGSGHMATVSRSKIKSGRTLKKQSDGNRETKKQCFWWCAACGGQYKWRDPNRVLSLQDGTDASEAKVFLADVPPECRTVCKLVETTSWDAIFREHAGTELAQQHEWAEEINSSRWTSIRRVNLGDEEGYKEALKVVRPKFNNTM